MTNPGSEASALLTRIPEPELMDDDDQARAYAEADFVEPHNHFVQLLQETFPELPEMGTALDLGCGPGDITLRFARAFPAWSVEGWDASEAMLNYGYQAVAAAKLQDRITLKKVYVPQSDTVSDTKSDTVSFPLIFSNSLLHHLADPMALWTEVKQQSGLGTAVFIMDLMRPAKRETAKDFVDLYAQGEPEVLRRDFFNSLLAAYRVDEVQDQLAQAGLEQLQVREVSDLHLIIWGHIAE
ncbi:class I SAM-dependent methyltransferase [Acaryochloris marina]|uniref:Methyltransferase domain-containing protein n=1 Tax=Acaryochloris marina (strain MBIC 11017) TaxID=329726 RepID=B0C999_ACAM1|nr:class I SAM-dependent methyltransferase [Acaryochloris marina]ABW27780.1 conserved hypothetical protein [Acaryochloris marina MBIC11017]BDM82509.1 SAM-dependent methyltransferase [Acaryochloris marina MBIC10699]